MAGSGSNWYVKSSRLAKLNGAIFGALAVVFAVLVIAGGSELRDRITKVEHTTTVELCSTRVSCQSLLERLLKNAGPTERRQLARALAPAVAIEHERRAPSHPVTPGRSHEEGAAPPASPSSPPAPAPAPVSPTVRIAPIELPPLKLPEVKLPEVRLPL